MREVFGDRFIVTRGFDRCLNVYSLQEWFRLVEQSQQPAKADKAEDIQSIFVKSDYKLIQIELKNILYIEGLKDYVKIYEDNSTKPVISLMSMKAMEEMVPTDRFMRVHRSYIVQKEKIRIIEHNRIVFGNTYIPIGDSYKQAFQDFLNKLS